MNDAGIFRPLFCSALSILNPSKPRAQFLDWVVQRGFNGVRVFAGALAWDGTTAADNRAALPAFLDDAASRGLYVEVSCLTDTDQGYDIEQHLREIADIVRDRINVLLEVANEPTDETQKDLTVSRLQQLRGLLPAEILTALGAAPDDESTDYSGGDYTTIHLDRGRDVWNQVRRVREMQAVVDATGKPAMNNEPIGAAEPGTPGQRLTDPAAFMVLGALSRLFEVGAIFHFEDGLRINFPIGPVQDACARAFIQGFYALNTPARLSYQNSNGRGGWDNSPVGNFDESQAVRAYSGVSGNTGYTVVVGGNDANISWQAGWQPTGIAADLPGCRIYTLTR